MMSYEDLLNSTSDFYSELMFASICNIGGLDVTFNKANDFLINGQVAEVKAIHDDYNRTDFEQNNSLLTKLLPNSYLIEDLNDEISEQLDRKKWHQHLSKAVFKQQDQALAQQYIQTIKHRNLVIDLGNGVKTNAQLTYPAIGKGPFPGVLLIQGAGAIRSSPEIAQYLSV